MTDICQSMRRMYAAANKLKGVESKPAKVARLLNESTQVVKNWETRGVSVHGALNAQRIMGCDAIWILDENQGSDTPVITINGVAGGNVVAEVLPPPYMHPDSLIRQVIAIMENTDATGRAMIMMSAKQTLERYHPANQTAA